MKRLFWWVVDVVAVICLVVVLVSVYRQYMIHISDFYKVESVTVSNMVQGEPGRVEFARTVKKPFYGQWSAKIYKAGTFYFVCTNTGRNYYEPVDQNEVVTMRWYMEKNCNLSPGSYYIVTKWDLDNNLSEHNISNIFRVMPNPKRAREGL